MILRVRDDNGKVFDIPAIRGLSSYEIAVKHGFEGTEEEWLESIGVLEGKSAFQVAVEEGFEGDVSTWLESLKGEKGDVGATPVFEIGEITTLSPNSLAYASITGTADHPILNLAIPRGANGTNGSNGTGVPAVTSTDNGKFLRVVDGTWKAVSISNAEEASF